MFFFCRKPNKNRKKSTLWLHHPKQRKTNKSCGSIVTPANKNVQHVGVSSTNLKKAPIKKPKLKTRIASRKLFADFKACIDIGYISRVYF